MTLTDILLLILIILVAIFIILTIVVFIAGIYKREDTYIYGEQDNKKL